MGYNVNEYVTHKRCGVCLVRDIAPVEGMDPSFLYYVLEPLFGEDKGNVVRVPVNNDVSLSVTIGEDVANNLISNWPRGENLYELDSKKRKASYEAAMAGGDISVLARLVEGVKQRRKKEGILNSMDHQFVTRAEPLVLGQLAVALGIEYSLVEDYIRNHIQ